MGGPAGAPRRHGMTLWQGRFGDDKPADELLAFTVSLPFDWRLASDDITGSRAHVRGLQKVGILTEAETGILLAALDHVEEELVGGTFAFRAEDEDVHTAVERRGTEMAGGAGAEVHTGRRRHHHGATDPRPLHPREASAGAPPRRRLQP